VACECAWFVTRCSYHPSMSLTPRLEERWRYCRGLLMNAKVFAAGTAHITLAVALVIAPTAAADTPDVLDGITVAPYQHRHDYRRAAFGEGWDNGGSCDVQDQILNRDLTDVTYTSVKRCPNAVESGQLSDLYTGKKITFTRGPRSSEEIQIDHLVPLAYAWDAGAWSWSDAQRRRFYFDPAELLAVDGPTNQAKGDGGPGKWMPPNTAFDCQYAIKFTSVLRAYGLPIDPGSATAVQQAC
jgi:Protein of unknown function (DUF1524)